MTDAQPYLEALLPDHDRDMAQAMLAFHAGGNVSHYATSVMPVTRGLIAQVDDIYARWKLHGLDEKHVEQIVDIDFKDDGEVSEVEVLKRGAWELTGEDG
ncbi:MAG: hypothetical protein AAFO89_00525 [Planctomycetota bacterium]